MCRWPSGCESSAGNCCCDRITIATTGVPRARRRKARLIYALLNTATSYNSISCQHMHAWYNTRQNVEIQGSNRIEERQDIFGITCKTHVGKQGAACVSEDSQCFRGHIYPGCYRRQSSHRPIYIRTIPLWTLLFISRNTPSTSFLVYSVNIYAGGQIPNSGNALARTFQCRDSPR